jgi:hypothetical protein
MGSKKVGPSSLVKLIKYFSSKGDSAPLNCGVACSIYGGEFSDEFYSTLFSWVILRSLLWSRAVAEEVGYFDGGLAIAFY